MRSVFAPPHDAVSNSESAKRPAISDRLTPSRARSAVLFDAWLRAGSGTGMCMSKSENSVWTFQPTRAAIAHIFGLRIRIDPSPRSETFFSQIFRSGSRTEAVTKVRVRRDSADLGLFCTIPP